MANYTQLPQQGGGPYPPPNQAGYPAPNQAGYQAAPGQGYPPQGQGYAPQGQGYPAQGQGYPAQGQGYPAQGQGYQTGGYPQQGQGYAPQGQGYPPQGQGYAPQGQGYPPQGQPGPPPSGDIPKYTGEMPDEDPTDDPNVKEPTEATAPPPELPQSFPGYGYMAFDEASVPPPAYEDVAKEPPTREALPDFVHLNEEEAKGALTQYVSEHCCYGKGPLDMVIAEIKPSNAFHYKLESFCESRTTKWESEPYHGMGIAVTGPPPGPWQITVPVPEMFKESKTKVEVPNSAVVKPCHVCFARGFKRCFRCHGRGMLICNFCHGQGSRTDASGEPSRCISCHGNGRKKCYSCQGYGQKKCLSCQGFCHLKWFIQLTVKWKVHDDDHIVERTALPPELIKGVAGKTVLEEKAVRVYPINHFPDQEVNQASNELVGKHASKYSSEWILQQRHNLRVVPVNSVVYNYKGDTGNYFVYGMENKIHFPDYPAKCCWGCNIL